MNNYPYRDESWGKLWYDTDKHVIDYAAKPNLAEEPYVTKPVVLNVEFTMQCNMHCRHCIARGMESEIGKGPNGDLKISETLIEQINSSPFLVIVVTGGEPLLPALEKTLTSFLSSIHNKGIVVDTNGTVYPTESLVRALTSRKVMVRVSWDSTNPMTECELRKYPAGLFESDKDYLDQKRMLIQQLVEQDVTVAVQSVMHRRNFRHDEFLNLPEMLAALGVRRWYIQRYIPTANPEMKKRRKLLGEEKFTLSPEEFEDAVDKASRRAARFNLECVSKKDRRHNSVFLLAGEGILYTQSDTRHGKKVKIGKLDEVTEFFTLVSSSEHSTRYYFKR